MAVVYPLANGNWSTVANWYSGGVAYGQLPLAGDDVYADGKTVTIDQNVTVANLYNLQRVGGIIAGVFNVSASGLTITANIVAAGSISFPSAMSITATGTTTIIGNITGNLNTPINGIGVGLIIQAGTVNVTGNVQGGGLAGSNNNGSNGITVSNSAILNLVGNVTGGASSTATYGIAFANTSRGVITGNATGGLTDVAINVSSTLSNALVFNGLAISGSTPGIRNATTGTVTINGNQTAVGTALVFSILNNSTGIITINGDCLGALSASPSNAYIVNNNTTGIVNINGNVTARSVGPSASVAIVNNNNVGGTMNISGNVSGGSVLNAIGVYNNSTGTVNVGGNITGGSIASNSPAIYSITAGTIDVTGTTTAGLYPALFSTSLTATNILRGNITNALGVPAYFAYNIKVSPTAVQTATMQTTTNVDRLFSTSNVSVGAPAVTNVRLGIVYGSTNELTGTMIVPTPANVRNGVPTDNTVGTADLTIAEFWDINASTLTTAGSIGDRVRNSATVQSTGDQLAAF